MESDTLAKGGVLEIPRAVAYLCGCAVRQQVADASRLLGVDRAALMDFAQSHSLASCVGVALDAAGFGDDRTHEEAARGIWRVAQLQSDWELARKELEREGIWYCPLKGAVVRDLYPAFGMRQMADFDVLFDATRAADVRKVMLRLGFTCEHYDAGVHDVYYKRPVTNLEMHRALFGPTSDARLKEFYDGVKDRLVKDEDNDFGWHMDVDECYLYLVAHEHKHFSASGTGLRSLLDTYVYLCAYGMQIDWSWVVRTAYELGLGDFEESNRELALRLFGDEELTEDDLRTLAYMASSGTYGTIQNGVRNQVEEGGGGVVGTIRYLGQRLFPPVSALRIAYPAFFRHALAVPLVYPYRLWKAATVSRKVVGIQLRVLAGGRESVACRGTTTCS
ncbi:MAG: nucleotidyltransferase family protein [Atopobiaceae bacterium]|nr:nucleotidyltransferase family protein [Atopobiaceae bacterium]